MSEFQEKAATVLGPFAEQYTKSPNMWKAFEERRGLDSKVLIQVTLSDIKHAAKLLKEIENGKAE